MSVAFRSAVLLFFAAGLALAEDRNFTLTGHVTDPSGAALPNIPVKLYSRGASGTYSAISDSQGAWSVLVPAGEYLVQAYAPGFALPKARQSLIVSGPQDIPLQLSLTDVAASISVTATGTPQSLDETA